LIAAPIEDIAVPGAAPAPDSAARAAAAGAVPSPAPAAAPAAPTTSDAATAPAGKPAPLRDTSFVVDRVVAVVGNRPILVSQVDEEIFSRQSQGGKPPSTPEEAAELRKQVIQSIIDEELMVQEAERDTTIKVTDQEIADGVEQQIKKIRSNFSSELDYASELRKAGFQTPDEYRRWLFDQQRRAALQNRLIDERRSSGKLKSVVPTEKEMRTYFEQQKTVLEKRPATISFHQIVVAPQPSVDEKQRAYQLADSIAQGIRRGGDFAVAAKRFSMDSGSRELGGSLNWFRRGTMVPEFERVAFGLKPGVVSDPVETPFGYHIIQVERSQPGEVQARHILIMPEITEQEGDSAHKLAESIYQALKGGASFDSLQNRYHDRPEEREARDVPITKLPPAYAQAIGTSGEGAIITPFALEGAAGARIKYAVVLITARRPEGDVRYEDVRDKVRQQLGDQLGVRRYLDQLRKKAYVEIRT
jgi:peptidyl-prolyl cis-trans isomerase SurA